MEKTKKTSFGEFKLKRIGTTAMCAVGRFRQDKIYEDEYGNIWIESELDGKEDQDPLYIRKDILKEILRYYKNNPGKYEAL